MKESYHAVCDTCKEFCKIFICNPSCTAHLLADKDELIQQFLSKHWNCDLRLIHQDYDLDFLFDNKYLNIK